MIMIILMTIMMIILVMEHLWQEETPPPIKHGSRSGDFQARVSRTALNCTFLNIVWFYTHRINIWYTLYTFTHLLNSLTLPIHYHLLWRFYLNRGHLGWFKTREAPGVTKAAAWIRKSTSLPFYDFSLTIFQLIRTQQQKQNPDCPYECWLRQRSPPHASLSWLCEVSGNTEPSSAGPLPPSPTNWVPLPSVPPPFSPRRWDEHGCYHEVMLSIYIEASKNFTH